MTPMTEYRIISRLRGCDELVARAWSRDTAEAKKQAAKLAVRATQSDAEIFLVTVEK